MSGAGPTFWAESEPTVQRVSGVPLSRTMVAGFATLVGLLLVQLWLLWFKSFNWDEFLHYGHVFAARNGTLDAPFQVLHSRILYWVPDATASIVDQMRIARLFMFACTLVTLAAIFGLAQRFTSRENALLAAIAYLGAGYVFTQSFSIRADPMAAASLMSALYLMTARTNRLASYIAAGALVGLAGMITMKSVFYAPCFAGLAWLLWTQSKDKREALIYFATAALATILTFGVIYFWHKSNLAPLPERFADMSKFIDGGRRWILPASYPAFKHVVRQVGWGLVFFVGMLFALSAWKTSKLSSPHRIALIGLAAPLLTLLFYRNTYPYFFVYLLAPVAVAVSASWGLLVRRYGIAPVLGAMCIAPVVLAAFTPRDIIFRQETVIDYLRSEYPQGTVYLARSNMLPDYPRVISHLATGPGLAGYHERQRPLVAEAFARGELSFILASSTSITNALQGVHGPWSFLPEDVAVMTNHYVNHWGLVFLEGEQIESVTGEQEITIPRAGPYTLDGQAIILDEVRIEHGETVVLERGTHSISCVTDCDLRTVLWRGEKLPTPPPAISGRTLYTNF